MPYEIAGDPDLELAREFAKSTRTVLEDSREEIISLLTKGRPALGVYVQYLEGLGAGSWALRALQLAWEEWLEYRAEGDANKS